MAQTKKKKGAKPRKLFVGQSAITNMILITLITCLISGTFYLRERVLSKARAQVTHTYEIRGLIYSIFEKIKDLELSQYGYLITNDATFLESYNRQLHQEHGEQSDPGWPTENNSLFEQFGMLRDLTEDNPRQRKNLDHLEQLILKRLEYSDSTLTLRREGGLDAAVREISSRKGLILTDSISSVVSDMIAEEHMLFRERTQAENEHLRLNSILMYSAFFVFFIGLLLEAWVTVGFLRRRRQAEIELQEHDILLQAIMDGGKHAIFSTDSRGIMTSFNHAAERMLGYDSWHFVGKTAADMMEHVYDPGEIRERAAQLSHKLGRPISGIEIFLLPLEGRGVYEQEWTVIRSDGTRIPVSLTVTALRGDQGEIHGYLGIAQDITERKEIDRVKNEFISTVSHELRTPLTSIRGALGLMAAGAVGAMSDKASELITIARKNSERLVMLINDILDIEKMESGKLQLRAMSVSVSEVIQQALEANTSYGEKYDVVFVQKRVPNARVMADPDRLMQILANLLSNAAKFSPPGSEVWVGAESRDGRVYFSVRDFGLGISEDFRARIFQKFAQADHSDTRHHEGTGLGLSITQKLLEIMGGSIRFETAMGKGTTFFFDLPQAHVLDAAIPAIPKDIGGKHLPVLICEDDRDIATLLNIWLGKAGFTTEIAYTLAAARQKLLTRSYSVMTLDLSMPDGSGLEFVHELRVNPVTRNLPVVVVSVKADEGKQALNGDVIGVVDWLAKPIDEQQLLAALQRAVSGAGNGKPHVLHVEDDVDLAHVLSGSLRGQVDLTLAPTLREAEKWLKTRHFDLVVLDLALPDGSGLELLERLNSLTEEPVPVLILSAHETDKEVQEKVKAALVKSRTSEQHIVETILALVKGQKGNEKGA